MAHLELLRAPFDPDVVSWRIGSTTPDKSKGMALAYIDARDVMERLDTVCGIDGWQCSYPHAGTKTVCSIGIKVGEEWVWKSNGAGDSDVEAEKGALSDAFKRSAVMWGIGRYLYDIDSPWVQIDPQGRSFKIKESEKPKLRAALVRHGYKPPLAPTGKNADVDLDHAMHATDLIAELQKWNTEGSLGQWGASAGIKELIASLDGANRERVRAAYSAHMKALKEKAAA